MASKVLSRVKEFFNTLRDLQEDKNNHLITYADDIQILKNHGDRISLLNVDCGDQEVFICEKVAPKPNDSNNESALETSNSIEDDEGDVLTALEPETELTPQPLTMEKARQLLSWYTLSQNANVHSVDDPSLRPLWVRCDMSDPARTTWVGAEGVCVSSKVCGVKLYSVTCTGPVVNQSSFITLDELKQEHKRRHHPSTMAIKGSAQFIMLGSSVVENTTIESQSRLVVDFKWNHVEKVLETPPLSSTATLNIKVASGDKKSPMFKVFRELQFLQILADGLRNGEIKWMDPLECKSAVDLTKEYLEELQKPISSQQEQASKPTVADHEINPPLFNTLLERGDLDFVEQLWVRMRKSVVSYEDIVDCLKLVIEALTYDYIKPWIHSDNSSSLGKLIRQSYDQTIEHVSLTGLTPVQMLLEMGLDKMRKDYLNYLIGEELTTSNNLSYYQNTEVDLQEQVVRLRKLHHLLEVVMTCKTFLDLPYDRCLLLTQLCLQHNKTSTYDENHEFKLQIAPVLIAQFYQKEYPAVWRAEVSSGQEPHKVKTSLQVSDRPVIDHVMFEADKSVDDDSSEPVWFSTLVSCSLVKFA
nr:protein zwilch homolog [Nerophis lumbriciformis]